MTSFMKGRAHPVGMQVGDGGVLGTGEREKGREVRVRVRGMLEVRMNLKKANRGWGGKEGGWLKRKAVTVAWYELAWYTTEQEALGEGLVYAFPKR